MNKFYFWVNFIFIIALISITPFMEEFWLSTFLIVTPGYFIIYSFYLFLNRLQFFMAKRKFDDKIFIIPMLSMFVFIIFFIYVSGRYRYINDLVVSYFEKENYYFCSAITNCIVEPNGFRIGLWISKKYIVEKNEECFYVRSPNYAMDKLDYKKCKTTRLLKKP